MALIFIASDQPTLPSAPEPWLDLLLKKTLHALAYGILGLLWLHALQRSRFRHPYPYAIAFAVGVLYACSDEWHQRFVPGRSGQPSDVLIDVAGLSLALLLAAWRRRRLSEG